MKAADGPPLGRRQFLKAAGLAGAAAALTSPAAYLWRSNQLDVSHTVLDCPGPGPGFRLALLADVHAPQPGLDWAAVVAAVNAARPDLVVIAGDAINARGDEGLVRMYAPLDARLAKLACYGNWENWGRVRRSLLRREYAAAGVILLENDSLALDELGLQVIGLDERTNGWPDWSRVSAAPAGRLSLLLHHSPDAFDRLPLPAGAQVLQLSGHTHGGQVAPFGRPLLLPPGCGPYLRGAYRRGPHRLYVSRGIGNSHLPFRLGTPPEVALLEVRRGGATTGPGQAA